ncbi:VWA-like domain-containing protein [bacterium]|nr:VWA-like domain-containing protein [bacterium]
MAASLTNDEKLAVAFIAAQKTWPYFSVGLAHLVRRWGNIEPYHSMAVTRQGVLVIDPLFVDAMEPQVLALVLVHELQHLLRRHATRSDQIAEVNRETWGTAADFEINDDFPAELVTKGGGLLPGQHGLPDGQMAEEYYAELTKRAGGSRGQGKSGAGRGKQDGEGTGDGEGKGTGQKGQKGGVMAGQCGSGSGGEPVDGEPEGAEGAPGRSEADLERMRGATAQAIIEHASRNRGTVPAGLLRWAEQMIAPPKVRWQDKLTRAVRGSYATASGKLDYTRTRPSRRQSALDSMARVLGRRAPIMPALCGPQPTVAIGIDTSGSMGEAELVRAVSESHGVLRALGAPVTFLSCDAEVNGVKQIRTVRELTQTLRGGGGTDFRPIFAAVEALKPKPAVFIFITDGMGPAPESPPAGIHTIWVLVGGYKQAPCGWGEQIAIDD